MPVVERHAAGLHDGCVDTGHRRAGSRRDGIRPRTRRHKKYCRDRTARRRLPTRCSPGSYTAGSSAPALAPHAPTALDSAGLHGAKCRAEDRPHRHRTAGGPGVFDRVPGPSLRGRGLQLKREWFCAAWVHHPTPENTDRNVCRRGRLSALRLRRKQRQPTKDHHNIAYRAPAVKARLSPESRGFESPSTIRN